MSGGREGDITREQSAMVQGIAILFMVYHHLYSDPGIYEGRLLLWNSSIVCRIGWFGKICVALYAFVSGYGMFFALSRNNSESFWRRIGEDYQVVLRQIIRVYRRYWFVVVLYVGINVWTGDTIFQLREFLENLFAFSSSYQSTWWYMGQYIKMMLLLPVLDIIFSRFEKEEANQKKWIFGGSLLGIGIFVLAVGMIIYYPLFYFLLQMGKNLRISFFLPFCVGYVMAKYHVYSAIIVKSRDLSRNFRLILDFCVLLMVFVIRVLLSDGPAYAETDFILVPFFVLPYIDLLALCPISERILRWLGRRSIYIWLTHGWIFSRFGMRLAEIVNRHLTYYFIFMAIFVGVAEGLERIFRIVDRVWDILYKAIKKK